MIVDSLPGTILAASGLPDFPPLAEPAVQIPRVHVRENHSETVLEEIRRLRPVATTPRLDHVDLRVEVHGDVRPLGQR